ncbi:MAG: hypothetical protein M1830_001732 [Pleopsidium flavum]|nr:MAG: hypothetical protein M1830_001732 [Pleopsidium flavum]
MASTIDSPRQFKQPSRKGKKAWRKNVDITEVQEGLEDVREEVIKGGIIAEKPSDDLFTLDIKGSEIIQQAYNKVHKPLKAEEILSQRSAIPAIGSRKRSGSKLTDGVIEPSSKRRKGGVSHKELQRLKSIAYGGEAVPKDVITTVNAPDYDPWAETLEMGENQDPSFSFLDPPKAAKAPKTLKEPPISLVVTGKDVPAVKKPNAGISYNPVFQDWDKLLTEEGQKEVEAERKRLQEAREEEERLKKIAAAQDDDDHVQTEDESAWEGFESEYEGEEWLTKRRPERKTPAQRNKVLRRKEAERQTRWEAQMKKRAQQAEQIKAIAKAVVARDKARAQYLTREGTVSDSDVDDRKLRRRKLGKNPLPEPPLELVLPDELRDSLRLLKPEGNLLKDRFRNILVRGKMEARKPITQPKKARRSYTEKWTYKDFKI